MSSSEPVHSLLEVFRCGKRIPMFACGLLRGVGTNLCAQFKWRLFGCLLSPSDGASCHPMRRSLSK